MHWERIIAGSFGGEPQRFSFDRMMRRDPGFRPERVLFIDVDGEPAATASAWVQPGIFTTTGTVHYVGVSPSYQGRRLGYWVTLATMHHMLCEGRTEATLTTDDFRIPAIKTYLRLGFLPVLVDENQRERWRLIFNAMDRPQLAETYAAILDGPVWRPPATATDAFDYADRLIERYRYHPGRRPGRPQFGECDALGDEHLYKAAELGSARIAPRQVDAGANQAFEVCFQTGPAGLPAGWRVYFHVMGQNPLGERPQCHTASDPGFVELTADGSATVCLLGASTPRPPGPGPADAVPEPCRTMMGFVVQKGCLAPGECVTLTIGRQAGFRWTPLAGRKDIKIIIDPGNGEPVRRLPEPLVLTVLPGMPHCIDLVMPGTTPPGADVHAHVCIRDSNGNRVDEPAAATVTTAEGILPVQLEHGQGRLRIGTMRESPIGCTAQVPGLPVASSTLTIPVGAEGMQLYFGDLHAHDFTSQAEGFTGDVYRWARDEQDLDFLSVPPQSHAWLDNERWTLAKHFAEAYLDEGRFVTFSAFEWQHSHYGDKVVHYLGGDQPYLPVDDGRYAHPAGLYEAARASDALIISHHPGYDLDLHVPGTAWEAVDTRVERLTELWSMHGSSEGYDPADRPLLPPRREQGVMGALRQGLRLGFTAGSDTHSGRPGGSAREPRPYWGGLCAIWAENLTRRSLFEALWARRTVALTGSRIALHFEINGACMGSEIPYAEERHLRLRVWAPTALESVEILRDAQPWHRTSAGTNILDLELADHRDGPSFYHARVRLADGSLAVCSPVWVG